MELQGRGGRARQGSQAGLPHTYTHIHHTYNTHIQHTHLLQRVQVVHRLPPVALQLREEQLPSLLLVVHLSVSLRYTQQTLQFGYPYPCRAVPLELVDLGGALLLRTEGPLSASSRQEDRGRKISCVLQVYFAQLDMRSWICLPSQQLVRLPR
jgi:hypothetical protein